MVRPSYSPAQLRALRSIVEAFDAGQAFERARWGEEAARELAAGKGPATFERIRTLRALEAKGAIVLAVEVRRSNVLRTLPRSFGAWNGSRTVSARYTYAKPTEAGRQVLAGVEAEEAAA